VALGDERLLHHGVEHLLPPRLELAERDGALAVDVELRVQRHERALLQRQLERLEKVLELGHRDEVVAVAVYSQCSL